MGKLVSTAEERRQTTLVLADLKRPWNNRTRIDKEVCGAIELAYLRGLHSGLELGMRAKAKGK